MVVLTALACTDAQDPVAADPPVDALLATMNSASGNRSSAAPQPGGSLASLMASAVPHLAEAVRAHGAQHGAMFIEDYSVGGFTFIFFDPFPRTCAVGPLYHVDVNGSFYRKNPDGTVTRKLSAAGAEIFYTPDIFGEGPFYIGQGNAQMHTTGQPFFFEPIPGLKFVFLNPPFRGESLVHAVGKVVEEGTTGPSAQLLCTLHQNTDGSTKKLEIILR